VIDPPAQSAIKQVNLHASYYVCKEYEQAKNPGFETSEFYGAEELAWIKA
jgi:hypothetical protein